MKLRFASSALVFLVAMTMATGAFAQGIFTLSAGSEARGRDNGHAELSGGITLFLTTGAIAAGEEGEVEIDYGVPITNAVGANAIEVDICGVGGSTADGGNMEIDSDDGTITITVDGDVDQGCTAANGQDQINISGVRLSLVGSGASSITATISVSGDVRIGGASGNTATVITSVVDPLSDEDVDVDEDVTVVRHTGEIDGESRFKLVITEPHNDSFDGSQLELTFSGLPEDVNVVDVDAWVTTTKIFGDDDPTTDPAAAGNQVPVRLKVDPDDEDAMVGSNAQTAADRDGDVIVYLQMANRIMAEDAEGTEGTDDFIPAIVQGGTLSSSTRNVVIVTGTIEGTDEEDLLPIDLEVQVTVDLGPIGDEEDTKIPRFESDRTTAVTVIESSPSQTKLSAPFAIAGSGTGGAGYDTGIGVANMSSGRNAQPGAITFDFYAASGGKMSHKTAAGSKGRGLNDNGMLEPGGTYSVLLGELFPNAGNGHLVITTDFTKGDANLYISDFATFSATATVRMD